MPIYSPVAQLAEQVAVNHWVRGSSPCWGAKQIKGLQILVCSPFFFFPTLLPTPRMVTKVNPGKKNLIKTQLAAWGILWGVTAYPPPITNPITNSISIISKRPTFSNPMPFPQTPPATGRGCMLSDEHRMPSHWRFFYRHF